jgi:hypothetical protein
MCLCLCIVLKLRSCFRLAMDHYFDDRDDSIFYSVDNTPPINFDGDNDELTPPCNLPRFVLRNCFDSCSDGYCKSFA